MKFEDLPKELQDEVESLRHGSPTIEFQVKIALETSYTLEQFKSNAISSLDALIEEIKEVKTYFE